MKTASFLLLFLAGCGCVSSYNGEDIVEICSNPDTDGCISCGDGSRKPLCNQCGGNCAGGDCFLNKETCQKSPPHPINGPLCGFLEGDEAGTCEEETCRKEKNVKKCGNHCRPNCNSCNWQGKEEGGQFFFDTIVGKDNWCGGQQSDCEWFQPDGTEGECVEREPITCKSGSTNVAYRCDKCCSDNEACGSHMCGSDVCVFQNSKCIFKLTEDTRTATVNLKEYKDEQENIVENVSWYFQKLRPLAVAPATYYALQIPNFGYIGIQRLTATSGLILFSVWDNCKADEYKGKMRSEIPLFCKAEFILNGTDMVGKEFEGEGKGIKLQYEIKDGNFPDPDEEYYFALQATDGGKDSAHFMGYIYPIDGAWKFLGKLKVGDMKDWSMPRPLNWIENWSHVQTTASRKGAYGPLYFVRKDETDIHQAHSAQFEYNDEGSRDWSPERVNAKFENGEIILETGGDAIQTADQHELFQFTEAPPPEMFTHLKQTIEGCPDTETLNGIESCLGAANSNIFDRKLLRWQKNTAETSSMLHMK